MQSLFALVSRPADTEHVVVRGFFTTPEKAKNHDPILKGTWDPKPGSLGGWVSHEASRTYKHTIQPVNANEELDL